MDSNARSILKAVSYRLLGSLATALVVFLFSQDLRLSAGTGLVDMIVKIGLYFLHERLWNLIPYGRRRMPAPEYEI